MRSPARTLRRQQTTNSKTALQPGALRPRAVRLAPQATRNLQLFAAFSILLA
ncbi:hypothetical protein A2U01_0093245, partial [Trifolium medium]|nr:hypothetical protein [Trifolium medium]